MSKKTVIIVAGGIGKRFSSPTPKQFISIKGIPVIVYSIQRFLSVYPDIQIIVSIHSEWKTIWNNIKENFFKKQKIEVVTGGKERYDSVKSGLERVKGSCIVGIHDSVRPLVTENTIKRCYEEAEKKGSAVPVISSKDTIRYDEGTNFKPLKREHTYRVQTPQCFTSDSIKAAYKQQISENTTDDSTMYEKLGKKVQYVLGDEYNIKITTQEDLAVVQKLL